MADDSQALPAQRAFLEHRQPLRVAINAQIHPERGHGGVVHALVGLLLALGRLEDGPEQYTVIGPESEPEWLRPYMAPNQQLVRGPAGALQPGSLPASLRKFRTLAGRILAPQGLRSVSRINVPVSDGFFESLGCDVIHFPYQVFTTSSLPSVYQPWDLQHLHYPQFFSPEDLAWRETVYREGCRSAHTVVVASPFAKADVVRSYGVPPDRLQVIPMAPPATHFREPDDETMRQVGTKFGIEPPFALYPAVTWPHKNHVRLLEALAQLRDSKGFSVHVVCTGHHNDHWPTIGEKLLELSLQGQVRFLGEVTGDELRALYRLCEFVILPSLFEGAGLPLLEGWLEEAPVACSGVTALRDYAGDAARLFDPTSVQEVAEAIEEMATNAQCRERFRRKGRQRLAHFTWESTARTFRAVYRRAAGLPLGSEDQQLLDHSWPET